jgi:hypothetical protein
MFYATDGNFGLQIFGRRWRKDLLLWAARYATPIICHAMMPKEPKVLPKSVTITVSDIVHHVKKNSGV